MMSSSNNDENFSNIVKYQNFLKQKKSFNNWLDNYEAALGVYNYLDFDQGFDEYVTELLSSALSTGLNYRKDQSRFFSASMVLAQILFKQQKYRIAENHLLLLRELDFDAKKPDWISFYSAITYYKLELPNILTRPSGFFNELDNLDETTKENLQKKITIIKDFLNTVTQYFNENELNSKHIGFLDKLESWVQPYIHKVTLEYNNLMLRLDPSRAVSVQPEVEDIFSNIEVQYLLEEKEKLEQKVVALENEISELREKLNIVESRPVIPTVIPTLPSESESFKRHKILIYGATRIEDGIIYGLAKSMGYDKKQITIESEYDKHRIDFSEMQYGSKYSGVLFGPIAHSLPGKGKYSSVIEMMMKEEGYPKVIEIKTESGQLKVTKNTVKNALMEMKVHLETLSMQ